MTSDAGTNTHEKRTEDAPEGSDAPLLHLVFGGRVKDPSTLDFQSLEDIDIVGIFPNYASARHAWQSAAHRTVDDAMTKYVIVHLHRLLDPDHEDG
ncbi:MAG: DUF4170 domain-containing protein [Pseudomonadota bacterium]